MMKRIRHQRLVDWSGFILSGLFILMLILGSIR